MSLKRIPSASDLASLSRDDWEALGHDLCAVLYDTERVEDRLGCGNGLDALRQPTPRGPVDGWQFRRFDDRLENKQVVKLRDAVTRAVTACANGLGGPLKTFTVFGSIDLQPGHGKRKGEDTRISEFRTWCKTQHDVEASYRGVTWVRSRLLKFPHLRPELFEDLPAAIESAKAEILAALGGEAAMLRALEEVRAQSKGQLAVLVTEATTHLERGREKGRNEEFSLAIQSLRDAERLAKAPGVGSDLLARIQVVLTGVLYVTGFLADAVATGREALDRATELGDLALLRLAMGNLALALSDAQEDEEARELFIRVLRIDEDAAEPGEVVRTLANLLSVDVRLKDWENAARWTRRLEPRIRDLDERIGPSETSINALGNIATFHLDSALRLPEPMQPQAFQLAAEMFETMAHMCRSVGLRRTAIITEANLARVLWFLRRYDEGNAMFERVVATAGDNLGKIAADCRYNQAIMLAEAGRVDGALVAAADAFRRYEALGDASSVADANVLIRQISGGETGV